MNILIIGGKSSLAVALKPILSDFAKIITAGRTGCDIHLDLNDPLKKIQFPKDIDIVINTVAHFGGKDFEQIYLAERINALGTLKLCQLCNTAKIKQLIQISSVFSCLDKNSSFYSIYSLSKKHSEDLSQLYSSIFKLPLTILRLSQLYGVGEAFRKHQPFFYSIIDKAENDEDIFIYGSNDALRNFIHVEDVAKIISIVIHRKIEGIYTCMNTKNISYSEIAIAAINAFNSRSVIKFLKEQPDIPNNVFEIDDSLFRLIDYFPQISIAHGMKKEAVYRRKIK